MNVVDTSEPQLPIAGQTLDHRFEIRAALGDGGMGQVYRAYDRRTDREVALKLLIPRYIGRPEREQRFLREAELGQRVRHHHLVSYLEAGRLREHAWPFLAMALVEGHDLGIRLVEGPLPGRQATVIARQIAGAVRALHRAGVVHRDVTAMNVLIKGDHATLIDLSHAGDLTLPQVPRGQPGRLTQLNEVPGTHHYMSREQANADPAEPSMDVYAFGVTLVHMLTGRTPRGYGREEFIAMQRRGMIESPRIDPRIYSDAPLPLVDLAHQCVRQVAAERPSMDEIVDRLDALLAMMLVSIEPTHPEAAANDIGHAAERHPDAPRPRVRRAPPTPDPDSATDDHARLLLATEPPVTERVEPGTDPQPTSQPSTQRRLFVLMAIMLLVSLLAIAALLVMLSRERAQRTSEDPSAEPSAVAPSDVTNGAGPVEPSTMLGEPTPTVPAPPVVQPDVEPTAKTEPAEPKQETPREPERIKKSGRGKKPAAATPPVCDDMQGQAKAAAHARDWRKVLALTKPSPCWEDATARVRLRALALTKLQRYAECAALADRTNDPETLRAIRSCAAAIETSNP